MAFLIRSARQRKPFTVEMEAFDGIWDRMTDAETIEQAITLVGDNRETRRVIDTVTGEVMFPNGLGFVPAFHEQVPQGEFKGYWTQKSGAYPFFAFNAEASRIKQDGGKILRT